MPDSNLTDYPERMIFRGIIVSVVLGIGLSLEALPLKPEQIAQLDAGIKAATDFAGQGRKIAVFGWDHVLIQGDFTSVVLYSMLRDNLILKPTNWSLTSRYLTDAAVETLSDRCPLNRDAPLTFRTKEDKVCTDTILGIYLRSEIPGKPNVKVWRSHDSKAMNPNLAWAIQLQAGYSKSQIREMGQKMFKKALSEGAKSTTTLGTQKVKTGIRIDPEFKAYISRFSRLGFEVWISGSTNQYMLEGLVKQLGVESSRAIGIRPLLDNKDRMTAKFEGCSTSKDNAINFGRGKRCWVQRMIFVESGRKRLFETKAPIDIVFGEKTADEVLLFDAKHFQFGIEPQG